MKPRLSVLVIARNEEKHIGGCLDSVAFADEIIVIDDMSSDSTAEIAQSKGARVILRAMNGDFGAQQQFALEAAGGDWVLFLDCDERITPALAKEICAFTGKGAAAGCIRRLNHFAGRRVRFGVLRPDSVCRLMPRAGVRIEGVVHQKIQHAYPEKTLANAMLHYTYDNWDQYWRKFDQYTRLSAEKYLHAGRKVHFLRDIVLRPMWAFFKVYCINLGFLDGKTGWILSVNHYFYTMTKYVRAYRTGKNP